MDISEVAAVLKKSGQTISTAESCTGGLIAKMLTDAPGSSDYFTEGVVAYSNDSKTRLLGVPEDLIMTHGAVSPQVAQAMAMGPERSNNQRGCRSVLATKAACIIGKRRLYMRAHSR